MTLSESIIVFNLWAMVKTVQSLNSVLMVLWIKSSVSKSTAAVASSKTSTFVFLNNALLRQINCLCPTDRFSPPSVTSWYKPAVKPAKLVHSIIEISKLTWTHPSRTILNGRAPKPSTLPRRCAYRTDPSSFGAILRIERHPVG
jgi:hypothetical protein